MINKTPPKFDPNKLDFSMWHPLDHSPLSKTCREYYGGFRNHMSLLWQYRWNVESKIKKVTHCMWGRHYASPWFKGSGTPGELIYAGQSCCWCWKDLPESLE